MKKKLRAEANKVSAEAEQEDAKADGLNLDNIRAALKLQGEQLVAAEERNHTLWENNHSLRQKIDEYDTKMSELERKVRGLEKMMGREIERREYAEKHICLNLECKDRIPTLGDYRVEKN